MVLCQQTSRVNYEPNSFDSEPKEVTAYIEIDQPITGVTGVTGKM